MNAEQLQQFLDRIKDEGYLYVALQNLPGDVAVKNCIRQFYPGKGNPSNIDYAVENLVSYINKYPGLYKLYYRKSFHKTPWGEPIVLDTRTEETKVNEPETQPTMYDERSAADRRNDELTIRELMAKNAELLAENKMLKTQIVALEEELVAAEEEAEENATSAMADNTVSVVGQVASMLPAVLDKWFSLQEQKNQMLAEQLRRNRPMTPPVYQNHNANNDYHEEAGY